MTASTTVASDVTDPAGRWSALYRLALGMVLAMTTWFSASSVLPQVRVEWDLSPTAGSWLTIAVQIGFVAGAVTSAALNVADLVPPRRLMLHGALGAASANIGLLWATRASTAIPLRFATGVCLAAVYPPALKAMATWFRRGRGTALGVMVGALTIGSALPHLVNGLGGVRWETVIVATSFLTVAGGVVVELVDVAALAVIGRRSHCRRHRMTWEPAASSPHASRRHPGGVLRNSRSSGRVTGIMCAPTTHRSEERSA